MADRAALGARIRTLLDRHRHAGGGDAALLFFSEGAGATAIEALVRAARVDPALQGLPSRVLPLAVSGTLAIGVELWLGAIACGAAQIWILVTHEDEPAEREAIAAQMRVAEAILSGLDFAGEHLRIIGGGEVSRLVMDTGAAPAASSSGDAADAPTAPALQRLDRALQRPAASTVATAATFVLGADRRETFDLAVEHLRAQAGPAADDAALRIALAEASRFVDGGAR